MKLTLSTQQIRAFANQVPMTGGREDFQGFGKDIARIFALFKHDWDPFTRKDVEAVLETIGYQKSWFKKGDRYHLLTERLTEYTDTCMKADGSGKKRGYYTQSGNPNILTGSAPKKEGSVKEDPKTEGDDLPDPDGEIDIEVLEVDGVSWTPTQLDLKDVSGLYAKDAGLRRLAAAQTPCFGRGYSPTESSCSSCPLAAWCSNSSLGVLADIARDLDQATERTIQGAEEAERAKRRDAIRAREEERRKAAEAKRREALRSQVPDPAPAAATPLSGDLKAQLEAKYGANFGSILEMPFEGICSACGKKIPEGEEGVHLSSVGMHHTACALK